MQCLRDYKSEVEKKRKMVETLMKNLEEQDNILQTKENELLEKIEVAEKETETTDDSEQMKLMEKEKKELFADLELTYQPKRLGELSTGEQVTMRNQINTILDSKLLKL